MSPRISYNVIRWITIVIIGPSLKTTNLHESTTLSLGRPGDTVIILEYQKVPKVSPFPPIIEVGYNTDQTNKPQPEIFLILHFQKQTEKNRMSPNLTIQYLERILII